MFLEGRNQGALLTYHVFMFPLISQEGGYIFYFIVGFRFYLFIERERKGVRERGREGEREGEKC